MKLTLVFTLFLVLLGSMMTSAKRSCICPAVFDPVCGKNGVTYGNSCQMSCAGGQLAHKGECGGGNKQ